MLYNRASQPIVSGGIVYGILIFSFDIDPALFKTSDVTLSFDDAFGNKISATGKGSGLTSPILPIPTIHLDVK
jgi:hypothetical protein